MPGFFFFTPFLSSAQYDIYWTTEAKAAYELISELRIEESLKIIRLQEVTHIDNLIWPYLEDYAVFMELFYSGGYQTGKFIFRKICCPDVESSRGYRKLIQCH